MEIWPIELFNLIDIELNLFDVNLLEFLIILSYFPFHVIEIEHE